MDPRVIAAFIKAMAINADIEAMKAENQQRAHRGESVAYTYSDFSLRAHEIDKLSDFVRNI